MWFSIFGTSENVTESVVLPKWHFVDFTRRCGVANLYFWECTRRCGFAYLALRILTIRCVVASLVLLELYQKFWCCLFGTSDVLLEDVVLPIWNFGDLP